MKGKIISINANIAKEELSVRVEYSWIAKDFVAEKVVRLNLDASNTELDNEIKKVGKELKDDLLRGETENTRIGREVDIV